MGLGKVRLIFGVSSIREFCDLSMPIFMYDKDGSCVVRTLEEVSVFALGVDWSGSGGTGERGGFVNCVFVVDVVVADEFWTG